ncbi:phosphatase PAP2 family protein [Lacticaseibacillus hulanensis]|uniref:phosphatase PAP2 family protein n=1 Tax=Lacticaseibacillus hulanensis TaxID=2493111 RepID=UPI0013E2DCDA|nr:phosphatase PAP2 family protein [Lacticaseibacillus hulanensis]
MYQPKRQPTKLLVMASITAAIFVCMAVGVMKHLGYVGVIDQAGFRVALQLRSASLSAVMIPLTNFGNPAVVTFISVVLAAIFAWRRQWTLFGFVAVNMMVINAVNFIVKNIVERPRPFLSDSQVHNLVAAGGWSFPSGHSAGAVLLYGTIFVCATALVNKRWAQNTLRTISVALMILIPLSRIYVQVHYPTDVIAGFCLGATGILLSLYFFDTENV